MMRAQLEGPLGGEQYLHLSEGDHWLRIYMDPPRVEIDPDLSWDGAGKMFWNAAARVMNHPPFFKL